jgi:hypothetical protein
MTTEDLARLVLKCRNALRRYFKDRSPQLLNEARDWERRLDAAVKEVLTPPETTLFNAGPES